MRPTPAGETLLEHAVALAERLDLAGAQPAELADDAVRELRVGAFPSALATLVPAAVDRMLAARPELEIRLVQGTLGELAAGVRDGALHAALCFQDAGACRGTRAPAATTSPRSRWSSCSRRATGLRGGAGSRSRTSPATSGPRPRATA